VMDQLHGASGRVARPPGHTDGTTISRGGSISVRRVWSGWRRAGAPSACRSAEEATPHRLIARLRRQRKTWVR
jgi:hypothetical protein